MALGIIFMESMILPFGSNHSDGMFVLEVIFSSAAPWVLIQDAGLMDELLLAEGIQISRVLPTNMRIENALREVFCLHAYTNRLQLISLPENYYHTLYQVTSGLNLPTSVCARVW